MKKTILRKPHNLNPPVSKEDFIKLLNELGRNKLAEKLGIGKQTVYQWAKSYGLKSKKTIIWYDDTQTGKEG